MSKMMTGTIEYPMTQRIADTINVHGFGWALDYYTKHMSVWEFRMLAQGAGFNCGSAGFIAELLKESARNHVSRMAAAVGVYPA